MGFCKCGKLARGRTLPVGMRQGVPISYHWSRVQFALGGGVTMPHSARLVRDTTRRQHESILYPVDDRHNPVGIRWASRRITLAPIVLIPRATRHFHLKASKCIFPNIVAHILELSVIPWFPWPNHRLWFQLARPAITVFLENLVETDHPVSVKHLARPPAQCLSHRIQGVVLDVLQDATIALAVLLIPECNVDVRRLLAGGDADALVELPNGTVGGVVDLNGCRRHRHNCHRQDEV